MPEKMTLVVLLDAHKNLIAADASASQNNGLSFELVPKQGQFLYDLEVPKELTKLHLPDFKQAVIKALQVPGAAKPHTSKLTTTVKRK